MQVTNAVPNVMHSTRAKNKITKYPGNSGTRKITSCIGEYHEQSHI